MGDFLDKNKDSLRIAAATAAALAVIVMLQTDGGKRRVQKVVIVPMRAVASLLLSGVGFMSNFVVDLVYHKTDKWDEVLKSVDEFIQRSGLKDEMEKGVNDRFLGNLAILMQLQAHLPRRLEEAPASTPRSSPDAVLPTIEMAQRYMKFASAVYGDDMLAAVQVEVDGTVKHKPGDTLKDDIAGHLGVKPEDVIVADMDRGGSMEYLKHMIVIDHEQKAIVLAVRGTFSLSGVVVDLAGYAAEFCGGEAHSGMAQMARAVWSKAIAHVKDALWRHEGYKLILTGHSLGAGVACLMNILVHHDKILPGHHDVRCMAYAPPPVFHPLSAAKEAVATTTAYVHNMDIVPSLSVAAIRRLLATVSSLDTCIRQLPIKDRSLWRIGLMMGYEKPNQALLESIRVAKEEALEDMDGAPVLAIPAQDIVWLEDTSKDDEPSFAVHQLDPEGYACRLMDIENTMLGDHMPPQYEKAFHYAVSPVT